MLQNTQKPKIFGAQKIPKIFSGIKNLMQMKEEIDLINKKLTNTAESVNSLKNEISKFREEFDSKINTIDEKNIEFFKNFDENLNLIKNTKQGFEKELFDFKLLKAQLQRKIIDKFEEELDKELKIQLEKLKQDARQFNNLKEQISNIGNKVNSLSNEIDKFTDISKNIKKEDFELTKFANQLLELDREKIELMRKIDTLERLISKMRRSQQIIR